VTTEVRFAIADDLRTFYGTEAPRTVRAMVGVRDGKIAGIGGVAYEDGKPPYVFFEQAEDAPPRALIIVRGARALLARVTVPVFAVADPEIATAPRLLAMLGFRKVAAAVGGDLYQRPGGG
jgi:hypothetical protein